MGKSARNMGIDFAELREMASEASNDPPFLVIQATGKKSILRLTDIHLPETETSRVGAGPQPRMTVHQSADAPTFRAENGRSFTSFTSFASRRKADIASEEAKHALL